MTEVVVLCDRKTIFLKSKIFSFYQLLIIASVIASFLVQSSNADGILKRIGDNQSGSKFSSILLSNSPFRIHTSAVAENEETTTQKTDSDFSAKLVPTSSPGKGGDSLWGVIKKSFLKHKGEIPNNPSRNSIFATPKLKSASQAWEDLVTNAKSGFKNRNSPFQTAKTVKPSSTTEEKVSASKEDASRSPRGSPWHVDSGSLVWDTMKVILDVNKDLASHVWHKHVVHPNHEAYSPLKSVLYKPVDEAIRFKTGVSQIYKEKFRDLAFLSFLHKDNKVNSIKASLNPLSGWLKPTLLGGGWGQPELPHIIPQPIIITDASLFKRWVKAKVEFTKHLFLLKWRLTVDLIKLFPFLTKVKVDLLVSLLLKDHYTIFKLLNIFHLATLKGKESFLKALHGKGIYGPYGIHGPIGHPIGLNPHEVDLTSDHYAGPPPSIGHEHSLPQLSSHYEIPPESTVSKNPLYSYPSSFYSSEENQGKNSGSNYYHGGKGKPISIPGYTAYSAPSYDPRDSLGLGSEESNQHQSQLVEPLNSSSKEKETRGSPKVQSESVSEPKETGSRFSLKLLNSGFSSS